MAIADGRRVAIRFTQPLVGNVTGLNPPLGYKKSKISLSGAIATALNQYSASYPASYAINGNTENYWRGTTAVNWFRVQLPVPKVVTQLKLYLGSNYIKTFTFSGSNDGETWTQLGGEYTAASTTTAQWYTFEINNADAYLYYRIDTLTTYSSTVYLYEMELYEDAPVGNETKFVVSFDAYNYVPGGNLSRVTRSATEVATYVSVDHALGLENASLVNLQYRSGLRLAMEEGSSNE